QSVRLQWQQHHKLSGIERAGTGAEGFRYDRHGNLLAYTDGSWLSLFPPGSFSATAGTPAGYPDRSPAHRQ
ncbi:hypothetical protein E5S39_23260, partial [Escherichia coli]